jgi:thiol-disulfide isomerase/thioredoxin
MKKLLLMMSILVAIGIVVAGIMWKPVPGGANTPPALDGGPVPTVQLVKNPVDVPELTLTDLSGRTFLLSSLRGKVVLVNFWATWCPPCRAEIPDLVRLQERYRDHLVILGVSTDESGPGPVKAFADEHKMNYPIVMVTDDLRRAFPGVFALPTTFVIDTEGKTVQKHVGQVDVSTYENETRSLTGLVNAKIEYVEDSGQVLLKNAALATEIPGVDLSHLGEVEKRAVIARLNEDQCPCGCALTLAQCRINDPSCTVSLPIARKVAKR